MNAQPVVVGTDGSPAALAAVDWAADEAVRRRLPLRLVHAAVWAHYTGTGRPLSDSRVQDAAARVHRRQPSLQADPEVLLGDPAPALLRAGDGASMLVVGSRTLGALARALLGSVSLPVVARARCPVVVVRHPVHEPAGTDGCVVLGVGGRGPSTTVARFAFEEAAARGCPVQAVHAWRILRAAVPTVRTGQLDDARQTHLAMARQRLDQVVAPAAGTYPGVTVRRTLGAGQAAEILLEASAAAALLVVGARRGTSHTGPRLGAVNQAMLHHAPCPVAVVPRA